MYIVELLGPTCNKNLPIPIFKKDSLLLCENYRPISLLPIFSKIFEKVIYERMYDFAEQNKLIYEQQFGFRARHSTNHALISTTESIKSQIDQGNYVRGVFIDLQKAFDMLNHDILCKKNLHTMALEEIVNFSSDLFFQIGNNLSL